VFLEHVSQNRKTVFGIHSPGLLGSCDVARLTMKGARIEAHVTAYVGKETASASNLGDAQELTLQGGILGEIV
jgi:hypothetical protein